MFVALPALCVLFDSAWPLLFMPALVGYLHGVVVAAEEAMLIHHFGDTYLAYAAKVPRWGVLGL